nr:MAG TPA: hypothetical protein [Caudoviricetes sp.]
MLPRTWLEVSCGFFVWYEIWLCCNKYRLYSSCYSQ